MSNLLAEIYGRRELIGILVARNLKVRYKGSALGFLWTLLNPIFLIVVYSVFLAILRFEIDLAVLITGIIAWQFLAMCLGDGLSTILGNANLVKKIAFPRLILPTAMVAANLVNFLLSLLVLLAYLLVVGPDFGPLWLLPVVVLTQVALCLGLGLVISGINVFFRDTEHILQTILLAWFFLTPVIYPLSIVPERFQALAFLNPMTGILSVYRHMFLSSPLPTTRWLWPSFLLSWAALGVGVAVFQRLQRHFADEL